MYELVSADTSVVIANVLVVIILCLVVVIVGCALLLILQFILGTCGCLFSIICKPTILVYNKFRNESLLNEQEELLI
ncbi:Small membrane protein [Bat coronavirus HKU9-3]|uniref:Small membrane protein n=3 Tax=Bat coronavirus HKU9 TaxID=694006 RepID=A3EXI4_BCHK9|nr:Small membrane protein [Bat coronavirus HKU9-3]ADM33560.1 small membrane protein [Bat coronavirus HKU9-5-1]ADM33576.1 small membrane protein [Bat coronavirus HKU9-10-1]